MDKCHNILDNCASKDMTKIVKSNVQNRGKYLQVKYLSKGFNI